MSVSEKLIEDFFNHKCSDEQAALVRKYLQDNPLEVERYLPIDEWEIAARSLNIPLPPAFWEKQWDNINKQKKGKSVFAMLKPLSVAASVILLIGISILLLYKMNLSDKSGRIESALKTIKNNSGHRERVLMPDGSVIVLQPLSEISFKEGPDSLTRDISLLGEADFFVAKDTTRPFTVYSGSLSTRAVGTMFKVVHWQDSAATKVFLYEGKVFVKTEDGNNKGSYLIPGDVLVYHNGEKKLTINREVKSDAEIKTKPPSESKEGASGSNKKQNGWQRSRSDVIRVPNWYRFEKESLSNVFDQLAGLYKVRIIYNEKDLEHTYFIGQFDKTKSIDQVLELIANLNHLKVEKIADKQYLITR